MCAAKKNVYKCICGADPKPHTTTGENKMSREVTVHAMFCTHCGMSSPYVLNTKKGEDIEAWNRLIYLARIGQVVEELVTSQSIKDLMSE